MGTPKPVPSSLFSLLSSTKRQAKKEEKEEEEEEQRSHPTAEELESERERAREEAREQQQRAIEKERSDRRAQQQAALEEAQLAQSAREEVLRQSNAALTNQWETEKRAIADLHSQATLLLQQPLRPQSTLGPLRESCESCLRLNGVLGCREELNMIHQRQWPSTLAPSV